MKKISLNFIGTGFNSLNEAYVEIYTSSKTLVYKGITNNGKIILCLNINNVYRIKARFLDNYLDTVLYVNNYKSDYYLIFSNFLANKQDNNQNKVTFLLTDSYYNNLIIEKGELILWKK